MQRLTVLSLLTKRVVSHEFVVFIKSKFEMSKSNVVRGAF
jgi:hypothetical protein